MHTFSPPYSLEIVSRLETRNSFRVPVDGGLRHARQLAKQATERGERNVAHATVRDGSGREAFECRNIAGKAVQVRH